MDSVSTSLGARQLNLQARLETNLLELDYTNIAVY